MSLRHLPDGRGHPYERDPDQRVPVRPIAGETLELRVTAPANIDAVEVELGDGRRLAAVCRGEAAPDENPRFGRTRAAAADGHLSSASNYDATGLRGWVVVIADLAPGEMLRYRFVAPDDATEWFECVVCWWQQDVLTDGLRCYRSRHMVPLRRGDRVAGFGERFDALDQRGRFVDTAVYDQYKAQGARSYLPMPLALIVGKHTFGIHVNTTRRCFFDVGASDPTRLLIEVDLEPGVSDELPEIVRFDGTTAEIVRWFSERTSQQLTAPSEWIYRLWLSGNEWNSDARVRAEVAAAAEARIPIGVLVIEAWSDEQTFAAFNGAQYELHADGAPHQLADFSFADPWPNPKQLIDDLHHDGTKVLLWQIPLLASDEGQAGLDKTVIAERGYCVRNDDGSPYRNPGGWFNDALMLDFTNPEATDWWLAKRRYLVDELGVDGFKTDGGEHAWGGRLRYADGTRGAESNNRYPVLYQQAYHRLAPITFSRAGFTGSGSFPCHWAGDEDSTWEAFRASIVAGLSAGLSGIFWWGWDIAGFSGPLPSPELYLRATAMAALCPIMQLHSEFNFQRSPSRDRTPWNLAEQTGDERVVPLFRRFVELRERLIPFLVEAGERAARDRVPIMRPLALDHPTDEAVWEFPYQYAFGDGLLVAPVCAPDAREWQVYLPNGEWVELGRAADPISSSGTVVTVPAPVESIPVFCSADRAETLAPLFTPLHTAELVEVN